MKAPRAGLVALFAASGAAGLVLEVVWLRRVHLLFGSTALAAAAVTAAFMAGLAVGSLFAARRGDRAASPLRLYGLLEVGIGIYAVCIPLLFTLLLPVYRIGAGWFSSAPLAVDALRFALALLVFGPATAAMGATLPLLVRHLSRTASVGGATGTLYAANTAGALFGVCAAGYWLLPGIGERATTWLAAALDLGVGIGALQWARRTSNLAPATADAAPDTVSATRARPVLALLALSGMSALACQVAWTRWLSLLCGSSVYAFTAAVAAVLAGIALGSVLAARLPQRLAARPLACLAGALGMAAATTWLGVLVGDRLPYWATARYTSATAGAYWTVPLFMAAVLALLPSIGFGAAPPLAVRWLDPAADHVSRWVGRAWLANTAGAIVGAAFGGLGAIPLFGIAGTLLTFAAVTGCGAAALGWWHPARTRWVWCGGGLAAALLLPSLAPAWAPAIQTAGPYGLGLRHEAIPDRAAFLRRVSPGRARVRAHVEGQSGTITIFEDWDSVTMRLDGKTDASSISDMPSQTLLGHLPMLLHPDPRTVFVVGWGSGVTAGAVAHHPGARVYCVEIEPAVLATSRWFDHVNGHADRLPNVRTATEDARTLLLTDDAQYDVIISQPSNPWLSGPAKLFTREFFQIARRRLRPGGVLGQWVQLYGIMPDHLRAIVRTFREVFPDLRIFVTIDHADLLLVGGTGKAPLDWAALGRRMAEPAVAADLVRLGIAEPADLISRLVAGPKAAGAWVGTGVLSTDDNGLIEYGAPRALFEQDSGATWSEITALTPDPALAIGSQPPGGVPAALAALAEAAVRAKSGARAAHWARASLAAGESGDATAALGDALALEGDTAGAATQWERALKLAPTLAHARRQLAERRLAAGDAAGALAVLAAAPARTATLDALQGAALVQLGRHREAIALLAPLPPATFQGDLREAQHAFAIALLDQKQFAEAAAALEEFLAHQPGRHDARKRLLDAYRGANRAAQAAAIEAQLRKLGRFQQTIAPHFTPEPQFDDAAVAALREGFALNPFNLGLGLRWLDLLRVRAAAAAAGDADRWLEEALDAGRVLAKMHRYSERAALEHAYTCEWAADRAADAALRGRLYAEGRDTLDTLLARRTPPAGAPLPPLRRNEITARRARLANLAAAAGP